MPKPLIWHNGKLRTDFLGLSAGTKIVYAENPLRYTAVGKSFLMYDGERIYSVAETFGGPGLMLLVHKGNPHSQNDRIRAKTAKIISKMAKYLENAQKTRKNPSNTRHIVAI